MPSKLHMSVYAAIVLSVPFLVPDRSFAQMSDEDDPQRVERLESQVRQLTGQNEELQFRNRQLEEQIRQFQAAQPPVMANSPRGQAPIQPSMAPSGIASNPPMQSPSSQQPALPPQAGQVPLAGGPVAPIQQQPGRRGDAFDPALNPNAPGAPRALGGSQMGGGQPPVDPNAAPPVGAPGGRGAGEPLDLANTVPGAALTTLPPTATPKDEFDLGIGYVQRKDYALAEETLRNFVQKYPSDRLISDAQYWLGESMFQRQRYRDAAEAFLKVTTTFGASVKAPDALLRLGQSLAALKEKEAACAAFSEVTRKYPRVSPGIKQTVDREQKRVKC